MATPGGGVHCRYHIKIKDIAVVILSRLFNLCYRRFYSAYENVNRYSYTVGYNYCHYFRIRFYQI